MSCVFLLGSMLLTCCKSQQGMRQLTFVLQTIVRYVNTVSHIVSGNMTKIPHRLCLINNTSSSALRAQLSFLKHAQLSRPRIMFDSWCGVCCQYISAQGCHLSETLHMHPKDGHATQLHTRASTSQHRLAGSGLQRMYGEVTVLGKSDLLAGRLEY